MSKIRHCKAWSNGYLSLMITRPVNAFITTAGVMQVLLMLFCLFPLPSVTAKPLPQVCELNSEEVSSIKVLLKERTPVSLKGALIQNGKTLGEFATSKPKQHRQASWRFWNTQGSGQGTAVLFQDNVLWNPYTTIPRSQDTNRVLFVGLASLLWHWTAPEIPNVFRKNAALLKAADGFWSISSSCLGGRMLRG